MANWAIIAVAAVILVAAAVFFFWWIHSKESAARRAASERTEAEVDAEYYEAIEIEVHRDDEEALNKWKENFGE